MNNSIQIRFAAENDLAQVNLLRKNVNDLHISGRPEHFKSGFQDVSSLIYQIWNSEDQSIIVANSNGNICGYACIHRIDKHETPYTKPMHIYHVEEICVDKKYRRQGIASCLISFLKQDAKKQGFSRIDLNMWEFNHEALSFYNAVGFQTYRRHMELIL